MAKILLVEDNELNIKLFYDLLTIKGFDVILAKEATTGIQMAKDEKPDLILMDIQLPGDIDGIKATQILKGDDATKDIPIIALTALAMNKDVEKTLMAGCVAFISKPVDTRNFIEKVRQYTTK